VDWRFSQYPLPDQIDLAAWLPEQRRQEVAVQLLARRHTRELTNLNSQESHPISSAAFVG